MSSPRAEEYRQLVDDVIDGGLLEEDEWIEIRDLIARVKDKLEATMANMPAKEPAE